jgi:hypothetical protein
MIDQGEDGGEIKVVVGGRKGRDIGAGEFEERHGGTRTIFLEMNESAGELDEAFVEGAFASFTDGEPEMLKNVVGLVKELAVEIIKVGGKVGIEALAVKVGDHGGDFLALTHAGTG